MREERQSEPRARKGRPARPSARARAPNSENSFPCNCTRRHQGSPVPVADLQFSNFAPSTKCLSHAFSIIISLNCH